MPGECCEGRLEQKDRESGLRRTLFPSASIRNIGPRDVVFVFAQAQTSNKLSGCTGRHQGTNVQFAVGKAWSTDQPKFAIGKTVTGVVYYNDFDPSRDLLEQIGKKFISNSNQNPILLARRSSLYAYLQRLQRDAQMVSKPGTDTHVAGHQQSDAPQPARKRLKPKKTPTRPKWPNPPNPATPYAAKDRVRYRPILPRPPRPPEPPPPPIYRPVPLRPKSSSDLPPWQLFEPEDLFASDQSFDQPSD
ncbi:MAG: hypothetical protein M1833_005731 [Piccolia ochrophora]|nr:MAG: hypothetical protein M1833_005731 [Piccolia ochrophora]